MKYKVLLKFDESSPLAPTNGIESIEFDSHKDADDAGIRGKTFYNAISYEIVPVVAATPESEKSCYDCKYYEPKQSICDVNYRAMCIANETNSARDCEYYTKGTYIDSDEHLVVGYTEV